MFVLLIIAILFLFYVYYTRLPSFWRDKGIPYERPVLFFGNFTSVLFGWEHSGVLLRKIYEKHANIPFVGMFRLNQPFLLVRDPDMIQQILVKDYHTFPLPNFEVDPHVDPIMACNPFGQVGEEWRINRGRWAAAITPSKLKTYYKNMTQRGRMLLKQLTNQPIEAYEMASEFLVDVIVSSIFGVNIETSGSAENPFIGIAHTLFRPHFWESLKTFIFLTAPFLQKLFNVTLVSKQTKQILLQLSKEIAFNCKENNFIRKEDLNKFKKVLQRNKFDTHLDFEIPAMVFGFLQDGAQTSSIVMSLALFELASNPQMQSTLRNEIINNLDDTEDLCYEDIVQMPYLHMIISEVLRLYPPGLFLSRKSIKPFTLPSMNGKSNVILPTGTVTMVPIYALHMDPKYFPDPETFDPERFTETAKSERHEFVYLPFGKGPRSCFGNRLALILAKVGVATIVRNFEIKVHPKSPKRPLTVNPNSMIYRPVGGVWVTLHPLPRSS